jgi:hypothetical protein
MPAVLALAPTNDTIFSAMTSALILNGQQANLMVLDRLGSRLGATTDAPTIVILAAPSAAGSLRAAKAI